MKWLISLWLLALPLTSALAQEEQPVIPTVKLPSLVDCGTPESINGLLESFEEVPVAMGESYIIRPDGQPIPGTVVFYANPNELSYTMVLELDVPDSELWCIISAGAKFRPYSFSPESAL